MGFYPDQTDDEHWKALLGMGDLQAPMLHDPQAQQMAAAPVAAQLPPEHQAMQALAYGPPPMLSGDNDTMRKIAMALAMFTDVAMNKGRTMGPIMAAGLAPGPDVQLENWRRQRQYALDQSHMQHELAGHEVDPRILANRQRALDLQSRGLDIQEKQLGARTEGMSGARDAAIALGADPKMLEGMTDAQVSAWKSAITAQLRQGGSNQAWEHRNEVRVGDQIATEGRRPDVAAATTAAQTTARLNATNGTPDEAIANFQAANPKLEVTDPGTFRSLGSNPRTAAQRQQQLMTATRALDASAELLRLEKEYSAIPFDQRLSDHALSLSSEYDQLVNEHQGIIQKIASSGSGSVNEREVIRGGIPSIHNPIASSRLSGIEKMLHVNVNATLAPYGIGVVGDRKPVARATQSQEPAGGGLGVTSGSGPLVGDGSHDPPGGKVLMQLPDGRVGYIPAENAQEAIKQGARRIQ